MRSFSETVYRFGWNFMPSLLSLSVSWGLCGIALGFDAINSEQNRGTLSRILSQPIHRDYLINAKFVGALIVIGIMLFSLGFLVMGFGLIAIGIPPTAEEFFADGVFYHCQHLLCCFLAESVDILFPYSSVRLRHPHWLVWPSGYFSVCSII